ncbi:MAG: translation initiation factor IF-2, partial [Proteobacteria bacterium]
GGINESDVSLATTSGAVIIGFNVRAVRGLDEQADKQGTLIKYFSVIYDIIDVLKSIMAGKLPPVQKEVVLGHAEVRATIKVPKIGLIAGTSVLDGKITRSSHLRLIRESVVVFTGRIGSLRRFKDDVREVVQGYECGIGIDGYSDVREGDIIESFIIEEHAAVL